MEQVYVHQRGPTVVVSNSVRLIEQTCGLTAIDEIGASLFLSLGWVGGDRTLRESVQVLPGGYLHRWESNGSRTSVAYLSRTSLAQLSQRCDELRFNELARSFTSIFCALSDRLGPLVCPITGGRDSRVLVAAVIASGVPASFFTSGSTGSADVRIGTKIAEALRLPHHVKNPQEAVTDCWDEGVRRLIRQNDGMVNLWQIADSISQCQNVENLPLTLWGIGGAIAKGHYHHHLNLQPTFSDSQILRTFPSCLVSKDTEMLKQKTRQLALQSVRDTCQAFLGDGFEPLDVPDAFYTFDRVRRWSGANARKNSPVCDKFTPFCTYPFIETAFAMPLSDRIAQLLHIELIRAAEPSLLDFAFDKPLCAELPKRSAKLVVADTVREAAPRWLLRILRYGVRQLQRRKSQEENGPVQAEWVEAKRKSILDVCLSQHSSVLWDYVDRRSFENIMSSPTAAQVRRAYCKRILSIATLFYYEAER
jgi:asparagine synthase (glutamine-hydrolysing)